VMVGMIMVMMMMMMPISILDQVRGARGPQHPGAQARDEQPPGHVLDPSEAERGPGHPRLHLPEPQEVASPGATAVSRLLLGRVIRLPARVVGVVLVMRISLVSMVLPV
jgi:hypothetical protein